METLTTPNGEKLVRETCSPWEVVQASIQAHPNTQETFRRLQMPSNRMREELIAMIADAIGPEHLRTIEPETVRRYFLDIVPQVETQKGQIVAQRLTRDAMQDIVNGVVKPAIQTTKEQPAQAA